MALVRMTEKKLAASRANAKRSKGPTTPAGKDKVSRNACKHHIYARKFPIPPAWEARIWDVVGPCAATVQNPIERAHLIQYLVLKQWAIELFAYETRLFDQSIARHRGFNRGARAFTLDNPLFLVIASRTHTLYRQAEQARVAWERSKHISSTKQSILHLIENTAVRSEPKTLTPAPEPLTMAAAAGSSASAARPALTESSQPPRTGNPASHPAPTPAPGTPGLPRRWAESASPASAPKTIHPHNNSPPP